MLNEAQTASDAANAAAEQKLLTSDKMKALRARQEELKAQRAKIASELGMLNEAQTASPQKERAHAKKLEADAARAKAEEGLKKNDAEAQAEYESIDKELGMLAGAGDAPAPAPSGRVTADNVIWAKFGFSPSQVLREVNAARAAAKIPEAKSLADIENKEAMLVMASRSLLDNLSGKKKKAKIKRAKATGEPDVPVTADIVEGRKPEPDAPQAADLENHPSLSVPKLRPGEGVLGDWTTLRAGDRDIRARYVAVEAGRLIPSHNVGLQASVQEGRFHLAAAPQFEKNPAGDINERHYAPNSDERAKVIERAKDMNPDAVISRAFGGTEGPPVTRENAVVLGGNGRTMSIQLAYSEYPEQGEKYSKAAVERAAQFGLDPAEVGALWRPVIVRVVDDADAGMPGELSNALNKSTAVSQNPLEAAVSKGRRLSMFGSQLNEAIGGRSVAEALSDPSGFVDIAKLLLQSGAITQQEITAWTDPKTGKVNDTGKAEIGQILLGAVVGDADALKELTPDARQRLQAATAPLLQLRADFPDFPRILSLALIGLNDLKAARQTLRDALGQATLTPEDWKADPRATALLKLLDRGHTPGVSGLKNKMSEVVAGMKAAQEAGQDMFASGIQESPDQVWQRVVGSGPVNAGLKVMAKAPRPTWAGGSADELRSAGERPGDQLTPAERHAAAQHGYAELEDALTASGVIAEPLDSAAGRSALRDLASNKTSARDAFIAKFESPADGAANWAHMRDVLAQADAHSLMAQFQEYHQNGEAKAADRLHAFLQAMEAIGKGKDIPKAVNARLKEHGLLSEVGELDWTAPNELAKNMMLRSMRFAAGLKQPKKPKGGEAGALNIGDAFALMQRIWDKINPARDSRDLSKHNFLYDLMDLGNAAKFFDRNGALTQVPMLRWFNRKVSRNFFFQTTHWLPELVRENTRFMLDEVLGPRQTQGNKDVTNAAFVTWKLRGPMSPWGPLDPPKFQKEGILKLIDSGKFADGTIKGPQDVERYLGYGSGYLYDFANEWNRHFAEVAKRAVREGWISQAQAQAMRDRYVPKPRIADPRDVAKYQPDEFQFEPVFAARDLRRAPGSGSRIWDPDYLMRAATNQEVRRTHWHGVLNDVVLGAAGRKLAITEQEFRALPKAHQEWFRRLADENGSAFQQAMGMWVAYGREQMQPRQAWERGDPVKPGEAPFTEAKEALYHAIVPAEIKDKEKQESLFAPVVDRKPTPTGENGVYVDLRTYDHMEALWDAVSMRPSDLEAEVLQAWGGVSGLMKRNMTVAKPSFWFQNFVSSLFTNQTVLPVRDFVSSMLTGKGHYANWMLYAADYPKWVQAGMPDYKTAEGRKAIRALGIDPHGVLKYDMLLERVGGGTLRAAMGAATTHADIMRSIATPDGKAPGIGGSPTRDLAGAILESYRRPMALVEEMDRRLGSALGSPDVGARISAQREGELLYTQIETIFKGAAWDSVREHNPQLTWQEAMNEGAMRTVDYRELPKFFQRARSWSQRRQNLARKSLEPTKSLVRDYSYAVVGAPFFLTYKLVGSLQFPREYARAPLYAMAGTALTASVVYAMHKLLSGENDEQRLETSIAAAGTPRAPGAGLPGIDDLKAYAKHFAHEATVAPLIQDNNAAISWTRFKMGFKAGEPLTVPAGGNKLIDLAPYFTPNAVPMLEAARTVRDVSSGTGATAAAARLGDAFLSAPAGSLMAFGHFMGELYGAASGQGSKLPARSFYEAGERAANAFAGTLDPATFWASRDARTMLQAQYGDRSFSDIMVGQGQLYQQQDPERALAGSMLRVLGVSKEIPHALVGGHASDEVLVDNILDSMTGGLLKSLMRSDTALVNNQRQGLRAARDWLVDMLAQEYDQTVKHGSDWSAMAMKRMLLQPGVDTQYDPVKHMWSVLPGAKSDFAKFVAGLGNPDRQDMAIKFGSEWLGKAWSADTMRIVTLAAETRGISPVLLKRMLYSAIMDDSGMALLDKMHGDLVDDKKAEYAPDWAPVFQAIERPKSGQMARSWDELFEFFQKAGASALDLPSKPYRRMGMLELMGPEAFSSGSAAATSAMLELQQALGKR
jgi:hypothetical protein